MRVILAIIAVLALLAAIWSAFAFFNVPTSDENFRSVLGSGEGLKFLFFVNGMISFVIFVLAGSASAALDHLGEMRYQTGQQTKLLEQIARQTAPAGPPATKESSVRYTISGING